MAMAMAQIGGRAEFGAKQIWGQKPGAKNILGQPGPKVKKSAAKKNWVWSQKNGWLQTMKVWHPTLAESIPSIKKHGFQKPIYATAEFYPTKKMAEEYVWNNYKKTAVAIEMSVT